MLASVAAGSRNAGSTSASFSISRRAATTAEYADAVSFSASASSAAVAPLSNGPCWPAARALPASLRLPFAERERFELGDLKPHELDLGLPLRARRAAALELLDECVPRGEALRHGGGDRCKLFVRVEQRALIAGIEQGLVGMLAVDVDEQAAERLQVLEIHGLAVDEGTRPPIRADEPAQRARRVVVEPALGEPAESTVVFRHVERHADLRTLRVVANGGGVRSVAQGEPERIDENGFAGARLAGHDVQAAAELDFDFVNDGVVLYADQAQHGLLAATVRPIAARAPPIQLRA